MLLCEPSLSQVAAEEAMFHSSRPSSRFEAAERMTLRQWKFQEQLEELGSGSCRILVGMVKRLLLREV